VHLEDITPHYAETLRRWRANFLAAAPRVSELGYDVRFRRLWSLYLAYCEGGFRERRIQDVQVMLAKPGYRAEPLPAFERNAPTLRPLGGDATALPRLRGSSGRLADTVAASAAGERAG